MKNSILLTTEDKLAARQLSDCIFSILHDSELASFLANELFEQFFGDESPDTPEGQERIFLRFERAKKQFDILIDYTAAVRDTLRSLDAAASSRLKR